MEAKKGEGWWPDTQATIVRPTHIFGKVKKKKKNILESRVKKQVLYLQAHDLVLLTPVVLNYYRYFVFVAFLDIW